MMRWPPLLHLLLPIGAAISAVACDQPPPPPPARVTVPAPPPPTITCPGGLLCEARETYAGWRVPAACKPTQIGQRIATCWLDGLSWAPVVEFYQSRYPHLVHTGPQLRISGQTAPLADEATPAVPRPTPPLLLGQERVRGVELLFLAGDAVDTAHAPTDTGSTTVGAPAAAPIRRTP